MKLMEMAKKGVFCPILGVFLAIITLPAQGMLRTAALARSKPFSRSTGISMPALAQKPKSALASTFENQEKRQKNDKNKQKFYPENPELLLEKNHYNWAALTAGLTGLALYFGFDSEAEEDKQDSVKEKLTEVINLIENNDLYAYEKINDFLKNNNNPEYVDAITLALSKTEYRLMGKNLGSNQIYSLSQQAYEEICKSVIKNTTLIIKNNNIKFLTEIIAREKYQLFKISKKSSSLIKAFEEISQKHLIDILSQKYGAKFIIQLMDASNSLESWQTPIFQHFEQLLQLPQGRKLIEGKLTFYDNYTELFLEKAPAYINELSPSLIKLFLQKTRCDKKVIDEFVTRSQTEDSLRTFINLAKAIQTCSDKKTIDHKQKLTQTEALLINDPSAVISNELVKYIDSPDLNHAAQTIIDKEKELNSSGYITFVHGRKRKDYFPSQLYTLLWELCQEKNVDGYVFPYIRKPIVDAQGLSQESEHRKQLLTKMLTYGQQQDVLYTNWALWANYHSSGDCTSNYIRSNRYGYQEFNITSNEIFALFGQESLYNEFAQDIKNLENELKNPVKHGNALIIGVPKEIAHEAMYASTTNGWHADWLGNYHDISKIIDGLKKGEYTDAHIIFCMPMTFDLSLNPESGIKIFSILSGDREKVAELKKKENQLFAKIRASFNKRKFKNSKEYQDHKNTRKQIRDLLSTVQN